MFKVIYHIDEREKWDLTLGNVKNMVHYYQTHNINYQIEVLANSVAVLDYRKESHIELQVKELIQQHVSFVACHNAIRSQMIEDEQLINEVCVVDAGVVELVLRQTEGYSYIKP